MHVLCVGLSHRTAAVELRERVAMDSGAARAALADLHARYPHAELAILSTCNRTELYIARPLHGHPRVDEVIDFLEHRRGVDSKRLRTAVYHHDNERAIEHLHRVACGLESMVLGEHQILGQVRGAYELALEAGTTGRALHAMMQAAIAAGKRARTETAIAAGRTSVSAAAVDFARHLFGRFDDKTVLTIGAGKMTELTLRHFLDLRPRRLLVCNRSLDRAEELAARHGGRAVPFERLGDHLVEADVVISSTGAPEPIVNAAMFKPLVKRRRFRPLFVIDIALPRDFDAAVGRLDTVYLYNMDDLQAAIADQLAQRGGEVEACEAIIAGSVEACYAAIQQEDFGELIRRLRQRLHEIGEDESRRTMNKIRPLIEGDGPKHPNAEDPGVGGKMGGDEDVRAAIEEHTRRLVNKILHRPIRELSRGRSTQAAMYATALRRLFDLDLDAEDLNPPEHAEPKQER